MPLSLPEFVENALGWFKSSDTKLDEIQKNLKAALEGKAALETESAALKAKILTLETALTEKEKEVESRASQKALTIVASQGVPPVSAQTSTAQEGTILERYEKLQGVERSKFFAEHKAEIINALKTVKKG